jgi:hypothetical protein
MLAMRAVIAALLVVLALPAAVGAAKKPVAPDQVRATAKSGTFVLRWRDRATDETRYEVGSRKPGSRFSVKKLGARSTRFALAAPPGTTRGFRVRACNRAGCSAWTKEVTAKVPAAKPGTSPTIGGCPVFPADNPWNQDVSQLPLDSRSDAYIDSIGRGEMLHPDFGGGGQYGIPFEVVPASQPKVPITFTAYGDESDPGPYPVPPGARIEGDGEGDSHVLVVQQGECKLYELYVARKRGSGWSGDSGAVFDLNSNKVRPKGWTSADAAGLPILPGLARYGEVAAGRITHALRFTVNDSQRGFIFPARHAASDSTDPNRPPMGLRLRMKASYDISRLRGQSRVIAQALKTYGMIVADNGSDWYITGDADRGWDDEDLNQLKGVPGSAFEVVKTGPIER